VVGPDLADLRNLHMFGRSPENTCTPSLCIAAHENFNFSACFFSIMAGYNDT
jgi:hypothetical protein